VKSKGRHRSVVCHKYIGTILSASLARCWEAISQSRNIARRDPHGPDIHSRIVLEDGLLPGGGVAALIAKELLGHDTRGWLCYLAAERRESAIRF
jgi:hypothetical protein